LSAVFCDLLGWPKDWLVQDNSIPQNLAYTVAQHHETLRPDLVLMDADKPRILIAILPAKEQPDRRPASTTWNATHTTRMAEFLHATRVSLGIVTNGERFTLVYAEPGQPTGFADFRAELWFDERILLHNAPRLLKSSGCCTTTLIRKPLRRPCRTSTALSSPCFTRCNTVCRETPSFSIASSIGRILRRRLLYDARSQFIGDSNLPRCAWSDLLAGDETIGQPAVN
jgi:hypothetical protein